MPFLPHTADDTRRMLETIGVASLDDLFADIPAALRIPGLKLDTPRSEAETMALMSELATANKTTKTHDSYLGGGAYEHYIPAAVPALALRGEFLTAYTPYQAEASQGTLQVIYEFQSLLCLLTGLDVANASMYDGASALAEACFLANRKNNRDLVLIPHGLHPNYKAVLRTYLHNVSIHLHELPAVAEGTVTDLKALHGLDAELKKRVSAVVIPVTNFFGAVEPWREMAAWAHEHGALAIAVANPMALSVLEAPGAWGADVCVGEAQSIGLALEWGGPYCGYMTAKQEFVRTMPGRIVGCTTDADGKRGFVLTLQTREQHIRRQKATSNICTNQGLMATMVTIYLALMGKDGFRRLGLVNMERAATLRSRLLRDVPSIKALGNEPYFNEFAVRLPLPASQFIEAMKLHGVLAGLPAVDKNPTSHGTWKGLDDVLVICATETKTEAHLEHYLNAAKYVVATAPRSMATARA